MVTMIASYLSSPADGESVPLYVLEELGVGSYTEFSGRTPSTGIRNNFNRCLLAAHAGGNVLD